MSFPHPPAIFTFSEKHFQRKKGQMIDAQGAVVFIFEKPNGEVSVKAPNGAHVGSFRPSEFRTKKVEEGGVTQDASKYLDKKTLEFKTLHGRKLRWIGDSVCVDEFYNCMAIYERRPKKGGPILAVHSTGYEMLGSIILSLMVLEHRLEDKSDSSIAEGVAEVVGGI